MGKVDFHINGQTVGAHDLLLVEVHNAVFSGKTIPTMPAAAGLSTLAPAGPSATPAPTPIAAYQAPTGAGAALEYRTRQLSRSKRKVVATLSGTAVGAVVTGLVSAALLATPVGWAIGGAMAVGAAAALAGYVAMRCIRNARAWYYEKYALPDFLGRIQHEASVDTVSNETANGVRYWLQKRKISVIADDVRDLNRALQTYENQKALPLGNCTSCMALARAFESVNLLAAKLGRDMEVFTKFHGWMRRQLLKVYSSGDHAFTDARIAKAFQEVFDKLADPGYLHTKCGTAVPPWPTCCYAIGPAGKVVKPMVRTAYTLSAQMRHPYARITNDAAYIAQHGEDTAMASYHDSRDYIKDLLPPLASQTYLDLRDKGNVAATAPTSAAAAASAQGLSPAGLDQSLSGDYAGAVGFGALTALGTGAASTGASVGAHAAASAVGVGLAGTLSTTAITGAAGAGVGVASGAFTAIAQVVNTNLEFRALHEEVAKGASADLDRMVIALRTIMKDVHFFENAVDQLAKLRNYYQEFAATYSSFGDLSCGRYFDRIYRCIKAAKHAKLLNQYYPYVETFASVAAGVQLKASEEALQREYTVVSEKIRAAIETFNHESTCVSGSYCYGGRGE